MVGCRVVEAVMLDDAVREYVRTNYKYDDLAHPG